jgi:nucleoside-diphosphate-sugar epimerase
MIDQEAACKKVLVMIRLPWLVISSRVLQVLLDLLWPGRCWRGGDKVVGFDNFSTGKRENISDVENELELHEADLLDLDALQHACRGIDYILHEAAIPSVPWSVEDPVSNNRANVDGTLNLLVAAQDAKVTRVIYAASSSAYGDVPALPRFRSHGSREIL